MLGVEDVLCELGREEVNEQGLPPGFRFHPTDEELITFYLASKVFHGSFCGIHIAEIDLNRSEPWDLPEVSRMGDGEWYFFSSRDRKYPTGLRTNRATGAGYWKATGKDREVYGFGGALLIGMKKTLVFYRGRAPRGHKTRWVMHEYRLHGHFSYRHNTSKEEWVICRIFHKGEKRSPLITQEEQMSYIERQHQLLEAPPTVSSSSSCKYIETPITSGHLLGSQFHQNPFLMPHQMNPFQPNPPTFQANMTGASSSSSLQLSKSLFSHQERTSLKQEKNPILVHNNQCTALEELPRTHNNEMKQNSVCNQQQFLSASFLEETLNNGSVDMSSSTSSIGFHHLMMTMMTTDAPHHPIAAPPESSWLV